MKRAHKLVHFVARPIGINMQIYMYMYIIHSNCILLTGNFSRRRWQSIWADSRGESGVRVLRGGQSLRVQGVKQGPIIRQPESYRTILCM